MTSTLDHRLTVVRVLTVGFAVGFLGVRLPHLFAFAHYEADRFDPVGVLAWLDEPINPSLWRAGLLS